MKKQNGTITIEARDTVGGGKIALELPPDIAKELSFLPENKQAEYAKDMEQTLVEVLRTVATVSIDRGVYYGIREKFHETLKGLRLQCADTERIEKTFFILA